MTFYYLVVPRFGTEILREKRCSPYSQQPNHLQSKATTRQATKGIIEPDETHDVV